MDTYIRDRLIIDKKPITSSFLAQEQNISIKQASESLISFIENNNIDNIQQHFSITGYKSNNKIQIHITTKDQVDQICNQLKDTVVMLYSLSENGLSLTNINSMCKVNKGVVLTKTYVETKQERSAVRSSTAPQPIKKEVKKEPMKKEPVKETSVKKVEETKRPVYVSRKASTIPAPPAKRAKTESDKERERKERERKELEEMLKDDVFSDDDEYGGVVQDIKDKEVESKYVFDDIDVADEEQPKEVTKETKKVEEPPKEPVKKLPPPADPTPAVETFVDADGYVVRKINKPTKPDSSSKKQSNLMSFFKKK